MRQIKSLGSAKIIYLDKEKIIDELKNIVSRLKEGEGDNLKSVILFGSLASGDYTGLSDVDILIILRKSKDDFLTRIKKFRRYFFLPIDVDLFVYTEKEIERMKNEKNPFIKEILKEGVKID